MLGRSWFREFYMELGPGSEVKDCKVFGSRVHEPRA